jgi:outer membrane lipoprotein SlyB
MFIMMKYALTLISSLILASCASVVAVQKTNLEVETKMSSSIFLEPASPDEKIIYVQVRNTSDNPDFNIEPKVVSALKLRGYTVTDDPKKANYLLQANVLSVTETNKRNRDQLMTDGFGSAAIGGAIGAGVGALASGHKDALIGGALAGAALGTIANASFKEMSYSVITDVQVSQRKKPASTWDRHEARVMSTASKANLKIEQATPELVNGLSQSLAGMF